MYWVCKGRQYVKKIIQSCGVCKRYIAQPFGTTVHSKLPAFRVKISRPLANTGVDFVGPLYVKEGKSTKKVYVALFTCSVTRAVHLELTGSMKVESFIQTLRRLIARRGVLEMLISGNAQTFKKTSEWLNKLYKSRKVQKFLQEKGIKWRFNLGRAPWWGGLCERLVGSMKRVLRKVLKNNNFDYEELETIIVEVEGTLH